MDNVFFRGLGRLRVEKHTGENIQEVDFGRVKLKMLRKLSEKCT